MLQTMRSNLKGTVAFIIIGLLIIPLAFVGIEQFGGNHSDVAVAEVNDQKIYRHIYERLLRQQQNQFPNEDGQVLKQAIMNQLVDRALIESIALDSGLTLSEESALNTARQIREQQGNVPLNLDDIKRDQAVNQLQVGLVTSAFLPGKQFDDLIAIENQSRAFSWKLLSLSSEINEVTVTESEIKAHYEENKSNYTTMPLATFNYAVVTPSDFDSNVEFTKKEVDAEYEDRLSQYKSSGSRTVAHVFVDYSSDDHDERVEEIESELNAGNFDEYVSQFSDDLVSENGLIGVYPEDGLDELASGFKNLEEGAVSGAFTSETGTHFFKVVKVGEPNQEKPTFEAVQREMENYLQQSLYDEFVADLRDHIYNTKSLEEELDSRQLKVSVENTGPIAQTSATGIFAEPELNRVAFSNSTLLGKKLSNGNRRKPEAKVVTLEGQAVLINLQSYEPERTKSLEEARDEITLTLKEKKATKNLVDQAKLAVEALKAGDSTSLEGATNTTIKRSDTSIDRRIIDFVFGLEKPSEQPVTEVETLPGGDVVIVKLNKVIPGTADSLNEIEALTVNQRVTAYYAESELQALLGVLRRTADIQINDDSIVLN